ncbi:MAG: glycosyltransferase [Anaerolineae bacterium]
MATSPGRKRIVYLIDSLGLGGAERLLPIYLQHLDTGRFEPRVCALHVKDNNRLAADIERLGIPVDLLALRHLRDLPAAGQLLRYLRQQQTDLLHTQLEFADTLGSLAARWLGLPSVSTLHTFDDPPKGSRTYWRLKLRWWSLAHFCDRIIAVSEGTRQHHLRVGGLPPHKVITLYNGIDLSRFEHVAKIDRSTIRQTLSLPPDAPVLVTVAVLRPPKGIQYMIEALPAILAQAPDTHYLIVGSGEHQNALQDLARQTGVTERVIFAGARPDIPDLLAASDLFVLPTLTEALPTVLAEAMAAVKPIVVSNVGGVPEMIEHHHNGLLIPPADPARLAQACLQLLQNPDQARRMACAGREIVEQRFNIQRQAQRLAELYEELLAQGHRGQA